MLNATIYNNWLRGNYRKTSITEFFSMLWVHRGKFPWLFDNVGVIYLIICIAAFNLCNNALTVYCFCEWDSEGWKEEVKSMEEHISFCVRRWWYMCCIHNDKHSFEFGCNESVNRSCSTSGTCRVTCSLHGYRRYTNRIGPQYAFIYIIQIA